MANKISSPLTVFLFSCWHFSDAVIGQPRSARCGSARDVRPSHENRGRELTFARDKGDELADAFLHTLLGLLGNLCVLGEGILHDAGDWGKVANVSIVAVVAIGLGGRGGRAGTRRFRRLGRRIVRHGPDARRTCLGRRAEATPVQQGLVAMQAQRSMAEHTTTSAHESWRRKQGET